MSALITSTAGSASAGEMLTGAGQAQQLVLAVSADLPELSTLLAGVAADTTVLLVSTDADLLELLYRYVRSEDELRRVLVDNPSRLFGYENPA